MATTSPRRKSPRRLAVQFTPALVIDERDELIVAAEDAIKYLQALLKLRGTDPIEAYMNARYRHLQINGGRQEIYDDGSCEVIQEPRRDRAS